MQHRLVLGLRWLAAALLAPVVLAHCGGGDSCDDLQRQASAARSRAERNASLACTVDDDCVLERHALRCIDDCGHLSLLARGDVSVVAAATEDANDTYCQRFENDGCAVLLLPCYADPLPPSAVCRSGRCELDGAE